MSEKYVLLGASRGLGFATYQQLHQQKPSAKFLLSSRKIKSKWDNQINRTEVIEQDFSKVPVQFNFLSELEKFKPTHLIYFAGGGPYGNFSEKKWSDHLWALNTTFLYPAELLHHILSNKQKWLHLKQVILVGSAIAENQPDPMAGSYAAAKHALKGLVTTLTMENLNLKLELFSPGYMQTDLLPMNSEPRQNGLAENPVDVAKKLIALIEKNDSIRPFS